MLKRSVGPSPGQSDSATKSAVEAIGSHSDDETAVEVTVNPISIGPGESLNRIKPMAVWVNGTQVAILHLAGKPLHAECVSLVFRTTRSTFKLELRVEANRFDGSCESISIPDFNETDSGCVLEKHLRDPTPVGGGLQSLTQKVEIPRLAVEVQDLVLRVGLPSKTYLHSVSCETIPTALTFKSQGDGCLDIGLELPELDYLIYTTASAFTDELLPLRSHYIARGLASNGVKVGYIPSSRCDEITEVETGLYQIPFARMAQLLPLLAAQAKPGTLLLSSKPDVYALRALEHLNLGGWRSIYEVRDDMEAMNRRGMSQYYSTEFEKYLANHVSKIVCVSAPLAWKMESLRASSGSIRISGNGIEDDRVERFLLDADELLLEPKNQRIVYFGHMFPQRFDVDLLKEIAVSFPEHALDLYGVGADGAIFAEHENVKAHGFVTIDEFLRLARGACVGLLPFHNNPLTFSLSPLKYPQYLLAGLKIASSDVFALRGAPLCFTKKENFLENLNDALAYEVTHQDVQDVRRTLLSMRWSEVVAGYIADDAEFRRCSP